MSEHKKPHTPQNQDNPKLESDVYHAIKAVGWVVPENEHDVARAETALSATPADLPEALQHPREVFNRQADHDVTIVKPLTGSPTPDVETNLARAARQGGPIPSEIEQRMHRDRQAAEDAMDADDHGQADR